MQRLKSLTRVCAFALAGLTAISSLSAQDAPSLDDPDLKDQIRRLGGSLAGVRQMESGLIQAQGSAYKAMLRTGRLELIPMLGSDAPRNEVFGFTLEQVGRGPSSHSATGSEAKMRIADADSDPARFDEELLRSGLVVTADHEAFAERMLVRPEGIELRYVFERPLEGRGDLVVRGRVEGLVGEPTRDQHGLHFTTGLGTIDVGHVTGLSADGRTVAGSLNYENGVLEMSLPAEFVETAAYPIVLDPLVGPGVSRSSSFYSVLNPSVASDWFSGSYLVVWERTFSATDPDVVGIYVDRDNGALSNLQLFGASTGVERDPTVAHVRRPDWFVVAYEQAPNTIAPTILSAVSSRLGASISIGYDLTTPTLLSCQDPAMAGNRTDRDDRAYLVYQQVGSGIRGLSLEVDAGGVVSPLSQQVISLGPNDTHPAISRNAADSGAGRLLVAWESTQNRTQPAIAVRTTDLQGTLYDQAQFAAGGVTRQEFPDVDGDGDDFIVVWQQRESIASSRSDIVACSRRWNGLRTTLRSFRTIAEESGRDESRPSVVQIRNKFAIAWQRERFPGIYSIYASAIEVDTCIECESTQVFNLFGVENETQPVLGPSLEDLPGAESMLAFVSQGGSSPSDIITLPFKYADRKASLQQRGPSCGDVSKVFLEGTGVPGDPDFEVQLIGASSFAVAGTLLMGIPNQPTFSCGLCELMNPSAVLAAVPTSISNGTGSVAIPIPCRSELVNAQIDVQYLIVGVPTNDCPLFPGFSTSTLETLTIGR